MKYIFLRYSYLFFKYLINQHFIILFYRIFTALGSFFNFLSPN